MIRPTRFRRVHGNIYFCKILESICFESHHNFSVEITVHKDLKLQTGKKSKFFTPTKWWLCFDYFEIIKTQSPFCWRGQFGLLTRL